MPTESLFTTEIPTLIDLDDGNYTLGTMFYTDVPGLILGTRIYVANLIPAPGTMGQLYQWESDLEGSLLRQKAFGTLTPNSWNSVLFDVPVPIVANQKYITAYGLTHAYVATGGFFNNYTLAHGHLTAPATGYATANGKFRPGDLGYPSSEYNGNCYFVDTIFQPEGDIPQPKKDTNRFFFGAV